MQVDVVEYIKEISWVCLKQQYAEQRDRILYAVDKVFSDAEFINSKSIEMLEAEIAAYVGVKYVACVNSGTDALIFAMRALNIGPGDEVITPPNSFIASTSSIVHVGATPVFVDVASDQNIDPTKIEAAITKNTKAIMVVHLTGRIAQMHEIKQIAEKYGLYIIEDAAQAFGSKCQGKFSGAIGDVGCFSAHPLKNFNSAGDAGFISTNNEEIYNKCKLLRNHGLIDRSTVVEWGYVSRLNALQAELLRIRLKELPDAVLARRRNVELYKRLLDPRHVFIPATPEEVFHTYQCFVIQVDRRDELQKFMTKHGIITAVHYPIPIHLQPVAKYLGHKHGDFPNSEIQAAKILTIPVHQYLGDADVKYVSDTINRFYAD